MNISTKYRSVWFEPKPVPVEFVVLHYTAQSLEQSLKIFLNPKGPPVSCHFLIDTRGKIYELVSCLNGRRHKAFHAGKSRFADSHKKLWTGFNDFSLGIELVNWNGNVFPYPEAQYASLFQLILRLKAVYPALQKPERIVGHEHIAGFRGKKDPGRLFDWPRLFKNVYNIQGAPAPLRQAVLRQNPAGFLKNPNRWNDKRAKRISLIMESRAPFWLKKILMFLSLFSP